VRGRMAVTTIGRETIRIALNTRVAGTMS